ncbi:uncharacterized protein DNG_05108 [Cephalotrichum gorgonifer]|uniref:Homeobox domain-containing protein n=1 Tax=Cephalotrichum gorgonifer TaxID=2041049 RepID=A0AAE8MXU8_9PEZI|nr:uncharacterized protein DNG_05108 [Cephalotrichum gorgonifer]
MARQVSQTNRKAPPAVRHARSAISVLKEWYAAHREWPYPSTHEKESLSYETGMMTRQVSQWFVNTRRRSGGKAPPPTESPLLLVEASEAALHQLSSSAPAEFNWDSMTPLERWRNSPPEDEPAPLHAISQASENAALTGLLDAGRGCESSSPRSFGLGSSDSSSASSSAYSYGSAFSSELPSLCQDLPRRKSKKWHRPFRRRTLGGLAQGPTNARPYQCTFCTDTFKTRYDWTRHEATLHLVLEKWTCLPFGPRHVDPQDEGSVSCALCGAADPSESHIASHRAENCTVKPLAARTYFRKDHLRQHLRVAHGVHALPPAAEAWRTKVTRIRCRCGFCGEAFTSWPERNAHLAEHFRDGARMKDWNGCRGLDPAVALLVENAIPPYLIDAEANDPEPFSASRGNAKKTCPADGTRAPPTAFEALTERLGEFVQAQRRRGEVVTDEELRRRARLILYDDEDPWNQTPADNAQWLEMFKSGYGLGGRGQSHADLASHVDPILFSIDADNAHSLHGSGLETRENSTNPFTAEKLAHAAGGDGSMLPFWLGQSGDGGSGVVDNMLVPWSWQTPECLAEFRQMGVSMGPSACGATSDFPAAGTGVADPSASSADEPPTMGCYSNSGPNGAIGPDDFLFGDVELPFDPL